jgi:predicted enzyme involved in methoxymalonyl-ACP biosynthesis
MNVSDRFGDHGLVGAAAVDHGEIIGLVLSCRVLGLGVEHRFLQHIVASLRPEALSGRIIATSRNIPVRHIYGDNGFVLDQDGVWRLSCGGQRQPIIAAAATG